MDSVERVKSICKERKIAISKLEKDLGYANGYIGQLRKGKFPADRIVEIAKYLNVPVDYLITGDKDSLAFSGVFPVQLKRFPMLGEISCGEPKFADEDRESYVMAGADIRADFCLKARGDSMINARITDGDIIFIRQQQMVENGEIAAVIIEDEATLKRFYFYPEKSILILKPENPKYEDLILQNEDLERVRVLGKAVAFQSDVR